MTGNRGVGVRVASRKRATSTVRQSHRMSRKMRGAEVTPGSLRETSEGRMRRNDDRFAADVRRASLMRRALLNAAVACAVVAAAATAAWFAFSASVSDKLALEDEEAAAALVAAEAGEPYYALLVADLDDSDSAFVPDAIVLARVDEEARAVTLVSIPAELRVSLSDGERHHLRDAVEVGGEAELIEAVADFAEVDISHYARTDAAGISSLTDYLGGVSVEVVEDVDDPSAGSAFIASGMQTLSGSQALVLLRATNYSDSVQGQADNQLAFLAALIERVVSASGLESFLQLDSIAEFASTDLGAAGALAAFRALRGLSASSVLTGVVPGYEATYDDVSYYVADSTSWGSMMERVEAGEDPSVDEVAVAAASVDPESFEVTVRNGSGITGGAAAISEVLVAAGFQVVETGNADSYVYDETLVVYQDSDYEAAAESVVQALGVGRVVASNGYYTFDTDVLVVIGNDWMPVL